MGFLGIFPADSESENFQGQFGLFTRVWAPHLTIPLTYLLASCENVAHLFYEPPPHV